MLPPSCNIGNDLIIDNLVSHLIGLVLFALLAVEENVVHAEAPWVQLGYWVPGESELWTGWDVSDGGFGGDLFAEG
jgi:hypothetical protein